MNRIIFRILLAAAAIFSQLACFATIVVPPVTITGSKTATEKQIIGEQTELEKDVWMISSARTTESAELETRPAEERKAIETENTEIYRAFLKFEMFSKQLAELKKDRVVGENNKGLISNLFTEKVNISDEMKKKYDPALADEPDLGRPYRTLIATVKEINEGRQLAAKGYVKTQKRLSKEFKAKESEILLAQREKYQAATLRGEFIQLPTGKWMNKE